MNEHLLKFKEENSNSWTNWKWQIQNRIKTLEELQKFLPVTEEEKENFHKAGEFFQFAVTPYYLSLVDENNYNDPIRKQIIPSSTELIRTNFEIEDPLGEESNMPVKGLTHRYPDRVLWYLSHQCAVYCRFCTRKRKVGNSEHTPRKEDWEEALKYIQVHSEIKEVILSGGDPLNLSDNQIDYLLAELKSIPHLNSIRIHTRYPVTMPQRITSELCEILQKYFPIYIVTHFNHVNEISEESTKGIKLLITKGNCVLLNQGVLLSGINDSVDSLKKLFYKLISIGVKPYYLHQCDEVFGSSGFKVPIDKGIELMKEIRGYISGIAVPNYVADLTGGGGKIPLISSYLSKEEENFYEFRNFSGKLYKIGK
ncbi:MAG: KamA family radical SAM protein [Leptospiraceae bacterium]|nr:KamA family radical SAM protein [Leptospiraceae bacterium]